MDRGSEFVLKLGFGSKILECSNVVVETIIGDSIFVLPGFLVQFRDIPTGFFSDVKGTEIFLKVINEVSEVLICQFDSCIFHFVIPDLRKGDPFSQTHFVEDGCNFNLVIVVNLGVDGEVGFNPTCGISGFSGEVCRQGHFDLFFWCSGSGQVLCGHGYWIQGWC